MNVLLLSMPDSFEHMPPVVIRMPNGVLTSLAGNVDPHHRVAVADLIHCARASGGDRVEFVEVARGQFAMRPLKRQGRKTSRPRRDP